MISRKNPILKFLEGVIHDALSASISSFIALRLEEQYEKFFGLDRDEEEELAKDNPESKI